MPKVDCCKAQFALILLTSVLRVDFVTIASKDSTLHEAMYQWNFS